MMLIQHHPAQEYRRRAVDQFDQLYADAQDSARVMALVVHPYIMAVPHRLKYLDEALHHIARPRRSGVHDRFRDTRLAPRHHLTSQIGVPDLESSTPVALGCTHESDGARCDFTEEG